MIARFEAERQALAISGSLVVSPGRREIPARYAVELPVDEMPPIPARVVVAGSGRANAKQGLVVTLTMPVRSPVAVHDWPTASPASTAVAFDVAAAVPRTAIDTVMARIDQSRPADEEDELPLALEDAVEQLHSASRTLATD